MYGPADDQQSFYQNLMVRTSRLLGDHTKLSNYVSVTEMLVSPESAEQPSAGVRQQGGGGGGVQKEEPTCDS